MVKLNENLTNIKFNRRTLESFDLSELKRLRIRYEAHKESLKNVARAFCVGGEALKKFAIANKWKAKTGHLKIKAYEK